MASRLPALAVMTALAGLAGAGTVPRRRVRGTGLRAASFTCKGLAITTRFTKGDSTCDTAMQFPVASITTSSVARRLLPKPSRITRAEGQFRSSQSASSSATQPSRKRMKPLLSRLGEATQWPQGDS